MQLLTVDQTIDRLQVKRAKLYQLLMSGELRSITIGRRRLVPESELDAFVARKLAESQAEADGD